MITSTDKLLLNHEKFTINMKLQRFSIYLIINESQK